MLPHLALLVGLVVSVFVFLGLKRGKIIEFQGNCFKMKNKRIKKALKKKLLHCRMQTEGYQGFREGRACYRFRGVRPMQPETKTRWKGE